MMDEINNGRTLREGTKDMVSDRASEMVELLAEALRSIAQMTDADDPESYRSDDREGCLETVFSVATAALASKGDEV